MLNYKHILYAVELTEAQEPFIRNTIEALKNKNIKITLLHVVHPSSLIYADASYISSDLYGFQDNLETDIIKRAEDEMKTFCDSCNLPSEHGLIKVGRPDITILNTAKKIEIDAILVNGHSHNLFGRLGSTADAIINKANCDVIVLKNQE